MNALPSPVPVLICLMAGSFILGMLVYRDISILVRRHIDRRDGISHGQIR